MAIDFPNSPSVNDYFSVDGKAYIFNGVSWGAVFAPSASVIIGPEGPAGPEGPIGATGDPGAPGPAGEAGMAGAAGPAGENGMNGADGADGADGDDGNDGLGYPALQTPAMQFYDTDYTFGSTAFTINTTGTAYIVGNRVRLVWNTNPNTYYEGVITAFDLVDTLTVDVDLAVGPGGGKDVFNIALTGEPGPLGSPAVATTSTGTTGFGYMGLPQNGVTTGAYDVVAADAGTHIYSSATRTITIPANGTIAMPIGSTVVFIAGSGATVTIAITTDTMLLAGAGTTGSRTLAPFGMATAVKITATSWIISGNGLT